MAENQTARQGLFPTPFQGAILNAFLDKPTGIRKLFQALIIVGRGENREKLAGFGHPPGLPEAVHRTPCYLIPSAFLRHSSTFRMLCLESEPRVRRTWICSIV
jgi:hypothetical protein